jgi:large subunit ribosomal protein L22
MITATLNNYRQSPRKVRLVADFVRGKRVPNALTTLSFLSKRAALPIRSVIESAAANAKNALKLDAEALIIKEIRVDEGVVMKRSMPRARGSAYPFKKRTSRIFVALTEAPEGVASKKGAVKNTRTKRVARPAAAKA